jgi:DNA topoisomerase VI subunit A
VAWNERDRAVARNSYDRPAEFILLVEKDAAFMRLAEDRFYNRHATSIIGKQRL